MSTMSSMHRRNVFFLAALGLAALLMIMTGCGAERPASPMGSADSGSLQYRVGTRPTDPGGSYNGPGDTVAGPFQSSGCSSPPSCGSFTISPQLVVQYAQGAMSRQPIQHGFYPTTGSLNKTYDLVEYTFTVADFQALIQTASADPEGNITILSGLESDTQEIYFYDLAGIGARALAYDGTHQQIEEICNGDFGLLVHNYATPPNCQIAQGGISFSKACMSNYIAAHTLPAGTVLFTVAFLVCGQQ